MFFGGNENTLVLSPLATFSRSGSTAFACCRYSCHFLDPVSFFFHSLLHNSCTIPRLLFPSSYTLPDLPWKETTRGKLASPKARLIQAPGNEIGLSLSLPPFMALYRSRCFERFYRSLHTNCTISRALGYLPKCSSKTFRP